jgi:predicted histone-like DNA-binding protein
MLEQIAEEISSQCTLTAHDIKAVISALEEVTFKHLRNGESVRLGDLGSFHARLASKGAVSEEDFTVENFRGIKVRFVPSSKLRFELSIKNPDVRLVKAQKLS